MPVINPTFLNKSLITDVSFITDNTGGATDDTIKQRIFDRDVDLQYISTGVTTGDRIITIDFGTPVTVDTVFIQNHNMQDFKIESDGPAFLQLNPSGGPTDLDLTGNAAINSYFEVSSVSTQTIIITCSEIFGTVNGELRVGEIYIGTRRFAISGDTGGDLDIQSNVAQSLIELSDATQQKLYIRRLVNYQMSLQNVTTAEALKYCTLYDANKTVSFGFVPRPAISHPDFSPNDVWDGLGGHYNWTNSLDVYEFSDVTAGTFNINIDLIQAGGLD
jgi:hypothetical protein